MKAKHRSKCKSTYRNVSTKSSSIQRISTGDGEYVIYCDPTGILSKNKSPSPERHADPNVDVLNIPASIKVVTPEQLNNSISQAQAGLPEFQPTLSIPPLQFVRPQYQIPATIMPVHQQTQAQQQGLFVPQSNSIYLPPPPPPPPAPYIPSPIDTSLQTINKNIIQVFEVVMAMKQSVDKLKEDMASVKAYIDKEKDMIPVLITDKQVVPPTAAAAPQPPPQMMANYVPPIMASTRLAPSATTTMNVPSIVNSFNPRPRAPAPVRPMLRHMAPPVLVPPKAFAPKPQKPSVPVKKAQPRPPPPVVVQEPIVIEESLEPEQFVEETIEYLQGDDRDSPILEIRDDDPLLDLDWPIEVDITDDEGVLQTAETEKEDDGDSITFKVTSVEDFNKMNEFLKKNEKYKKQLVSQKLII